MLDQKIKQNPEIQGIKIKNMPEDKKLAQYADGLWSVIINDKQNYINLRNTVLQRH